MYKRKDSPYWWASYTDASGKRTRRSTGTADRREAEALLSKWKLEAYRTSKWDEQPARTFDELMLEYLSAVTPTKRGGGERDRYSIKRLAPHFTGRELHTLTPVDITQYIAQRRHDGAAPGTINKELGTLSAALNWARRDLGWDVPNPVIGRKPKEPEGRIRWITRAEAASLIAAASQEPKAPHLPDFIRLGLNTGMRRGEMLGLEWRRVDLQASLVYLEAAHQKSGKVGSVPLNREAREAILSRARFRAEFCPASPWVFCNKNGTRIKALRRSFDTACRKVGIEDFHIHDLRHTCAAWLVQAGVSIREVAELLRHSDIRITMRYAHLAPDNVRAAVAALEAPTSRFGHTRDSSKRRVSG
ncbi:tyrosine-type recombinase/integrase [Methylohalobius crimeensis]|uniref:tyrosine-type recombinase/integrase n=1 Tax=Methylohalobius crimeensis TaxID=244365 RepID=UPI00389903C0